MHVFEEVRDLAEKLGDPAISFDNAFMHSSTGWEDGDIDGINEMQETATQLAAELRQPRLEWQARFMLTARHMLEGDLVLAEERAQETLELGQRAGQDPEAFIFYNEQMLEIRRWQDRLHEFVSDFREVAGNEEYDFGFALTRYLYDGGEHDVARTAYSSIMDRIELPPRRDMLAMASL